MKKITLLFCLLMGGFVMDAQQTISFEGSEGYTLGDINGQNGWVITGDGMGGFVLNQNVSDEQASDGVNSFKIDVDSNFPGQQNPVIGGFYDYAAPVPYASAVFSTDLYLEAFNANSSDYLLGLVNLTDGVFVTYVRFSFQGDILVLAADPLGTVVLDDTMQDWVGDAWFNLKVELTNNGLEVFINGNSIYTGFVASPNLDIENFRFVHDNFGGAGYMDNFRTNDEPLSVDDFANASFEHYVDAQNMLNMSSNSPMSEVKIYNMLGQEVLSKDLSNQSETVDINGLSAGVYIANAIVGGTTQTFKFVKK